MLFRLIKEVCRPGIASRSIHTLKSRESYQMFQNFNKLRAERTKDVLLTYIWIDGTGQNLRAKTQVTFEKPGAIKDVASWGFDGSSTGQATGRRSDLTLIPVAIYPDPFNVVDRDKLVLCEVFVPGEAGPAKPHSTNYRRACVETLAKCTNDRPWFGLEQEYTMLDPILHRPLGWPEKGFPAPQGPYYCGVGASRAFGRPFADIHLQMSLLAGLKISGSNYEVMPGQWEYQIGPAEGIEIGDQVWVARYIMWRLGELLGVEVTLDPKPVAGDWNGTGAHMNFSTKPMREAGGIELMKAAMPKLERRHMDHIAVYDPNNGLDNARRLTGTHETAPIGKFSWGIGDRGVSIRITKSVAEKGKGWFEDRRPAANCDPYRVADRLLRTVLLDE